MDSIDVRSRISLERFIKQKQWLESALARLQAISVPAVDSDELDGVEDLAFIAQWSTQIQEIDEEVAHIDGGDIEDLRNLAKATSEKTLATEDTDLIELALVTLTLLDKVLHLLRDLKLGLRLLKLRINWNRQISLVKHELLDLTTVKLPKFVRKARWKLPSEIESDAAASQSIPEDEQGQAATHNAHAHISDILTLELANIRGQSDRLQHAILPTSARLIDQLIDASAKPLPDRFLDAQDEAESCVKQELNCVVEFAADLAKQRSATEAIWASLESAESDLQQLCKDAQAASLTLPSSSVAARLDERMSRLQSATEEARDRTAALPRPCCGDDLFSQNEHNTLLLQALQDRLAILQAGALHSASEQVLNYRSAVTTIIAADDFCSAAAAALHALRSAIKRSHAIDYAACLTAGVAEEPIETILSLRYDLSSALATAIELQDAASNISDQLRQRGMDPNMRKKVHDLTLSLVTSCRDAKKLLSDDERRISALRNLVAWKESVNATLQSSAVAVQSHKEYLAHYDVLQEVHATSVEPQSEPKTMVEAMKAGLDTGQGLITSITENFHPDDVARLVNLHGIVQKRLRDTLKIATAQREMRAAVALQVSTARSFLHSAEKLQATIVERISDHQLVSHEQYTSLMQQMVAFEQKAHTEVIFCAKPALESAPLPRLAENDTRLRYELNSRILSLEDGLRTLGALRDTAQAKLQLATRLHGLDAEVTTLHPEIEAMSRCDGEDAARLTTRLASLSAQLPDTDAFSDSPDLLALQADLQSRLASIGDRLQLLSQEDLVASGVMLPVSAISDDNQDRSVNDSFTAPTLLLSDNSVGVDMTPATGQLGACDDKETCAPACRTTGTTENSTELEVTRNKPLTSRQSDDGLPLRSPVARADAAAVIEKTPLIPSQTSPASNGHISDFLAAASDLDRLISETLDKSNSDAGLSASPDHRLQRHWSRVQLAAEPVSATPGVSKRLDRLGQTMSQLLARQTEGESPAAASVSNPSRTPLPVTSSLAQALPEFPSTPRSSKYGHLSRIPGGPPTSRPSTAHGSSSKRMATYHQKSASSRTRTISSITTPNLLFSPRSTSSPALNETPIKQRPRYSSIRRSSSSNLSLRKSLRSNAYIANPSQKLDQAVASIVNDLQMPVDIRAADAWQDESGRYWIGSPEPKLYFARILRSNTVMLRVGGGWTELGHFLETHYSHLLSELDSPAESSFNSSGTAEKWLSSSLLRKSSTQSDEFKRPLSPRRSSTATPSAPDSSLHVLTRSTSRDGTPLMIKHDLGSRSLSQSNLRSSTSWRL